LCFLLCFSFLCFVLLDLWLFGSFILPALSPTAAAAASPRRTHHGPMQKNVPMNGKLTVYITNLRNKDSTSIEESDCMSRYTQAAGIDHVLMR
jgi:hypothetical protein